jgi:hypothetical protein
MPGSYTQTGLFQEYIASKYIYLSSSIFVNINYHLRSYFDNVISSKKNTTYSASVSFFNDGIVDL